MQLLQRFERSPTENAGLWLRLPNLRAAVSDWSDDFWFGCVHSSNRGFPSSTGISRSVSELCRMRSTSRLPSGEPAGTPASGFPPSQPPGSPTSGCTSLSGLRALRTLRSRLRLIQRNVTGFPPGPAPPA